MNIRSLDHIVLCVKDLSATRQFYQRVLNLELREERPGKWSIHVGSNKISLQEASTAPGIAQHTLPGSGNFCLLADTLLEGVISELRQHGVPIIDGPRITDGAMGKIRSVYFNDPDGNLVEVSNYV